MLKQGFVFFLLTLLAATTLLAACSEPTREQYRDMAAEEVCDEAQRCDNLGDASYDDCIVENEARFNDFWPSSECDDGQIEKDAFETCMNRARTAACEENILDLGLAWNDCRASQVCVAESDSEDDEDQ